MWKKKVKNALKKEKEQVSMNPYIGYNMSYVHRNQPNFR